MEEGGEEEEDEEEVEEKALDERIADLQEEEDKLKKKYVQSELFKMLEIRNMLF